MLILKSAVSNALHLLYFVHNPQHQLWNALVSAQIQWQIRHDAEMKQPHPNHLIEG